jgi:pimeloyl-ACP methyl ester carboxylesterase
VATSSVTERAVRANGIDLHLAEAGPASGAPVVLLHGFPDSWELWRSQVAALAAAGYRVLAPDLRGFGRHLPSVACPTMGVWSSDDPPSPKPR